MSVEPIAVLGMACRLPGGVTSPDEFWELLRNKRSGYRDFGPDKMNLKGYYHPNAQRPGSFPSRGGYLLDEDPMLFDHEFFGLTAAEVLTMDPTQRKILEVAYEALENAGEPWDKFWGSRTGVFIGNMNFDYQLGQISDVDFTMPHASTGGRNSIIANRVNHLFNLRGPSMSIDTACSSSLYALHLAVLALRNGDCDAAIVGGSNLMLSPDMQQVTARIGALSPTSMCHSFDAAADGYARAEGFGALYLRRESDAVSGEYHIRSLIRATAINTNGRTAGISHPSAEGQAALVRHAYRSAGLSLDDTGYFECHGTGTPAGDSVEVAAVGKVFASARKDKPLLIGSVKAALGHAEPASGIIGVMKAILAMEHAAIPATIGITKFNPAIDFDAARVKVVTELTPWPESPLRRASVNSFGYGGANAHCILDYPTSSNETTKVANGHDRIGENGDNEHISNGHDGKALNGLNGHARVDSVNITDMVEAGINGTDANGGEVKAAETTGANFNRGDVNGVESNGIHKSHSNDSATRRLVLLPFSAHLPGSLGSNIEVLREGIRELPLADVAYTLAKRRSKFQHRAFAIIEHENPDVGLETGRIVPGTSSSNAENVRLGFVFTGQGAQWQGMGSKLFEYKVFRDSIRQQDAALRQLSFAPTWSLEDLFAPNSGSQVSLEEAEVSQTACSALQVAVVDLLRCWGVTPSVVVGHSSGEIAAAYASGKATLEQSIITAFCRGRALATPQQPGAMLAVGLSVEETRSLLTAGGHDEHVQVAAVNSPQSVTIAGDAEKIDEIQRDLKAAGAFARLLKTSGKAYHSHHMRPVGKEYEATLSEVLPASKDAANNEGMEPRPRWISSVKPTKPTETTNARYWRENLESPVQFAAAVDGMLNEGVDLLIEIGPHAALQSPVKQIIAGRGDSRGPTYLPSLRRGEDGMRDMLTLCGHLWSHNYPVDLVTANATDDGRHGGVCKDLPRFRWVYGPPLNYETRITRHARERRHLRHDLLGALLMGSPTDRPVWRNLLRLRDVPWLQDHKLAPNAVLPGSAYVCLAIEAAWQHFELRNGIPPQEASFRLRNVKILSALQIPDTDAGVEIMLHLQPSTSSDWLQFNISSAPPHKDVWTQHASGLVSVRPNRPSMSPRLDTEMDPRGVDVAEWYAAFAEAGIEFGPTFQGLSALQADARTNICSANVALHTTHHLFNGPESEYVAIHPASLDMCNQLSLISLHGGEPDLLRHAYIPISIDEMTIWPQSPSDTNAQCTVVGHKKGLRGGYASVQLSTASGQPLVEIKTLQCISYDGNEKIATQASAHEYMRLAWKPDISHMSSARAGQHLHSLLDLASHQNPEMKVLEIGSDAGGASDTLDYLDSSSTKRYGTFRFAKVSEGLDAASPEASTSEKQLFSKFGLEQGLDSDYDVVIFRFGSEFESLDASEALQAIRKLMKKDGTLILTDATIKDSSVLAVALGSAGFKFSSGQVENYTDSSSSVSTIMATAIEGASAKISPNSGSKVYIVYDQRETSLSAAIASELQARTAGAVLAPLQDCELPERSRIIFVPNPERSILASATEEDFARVKYIVQHASSLLWVTPGDIVGGMNPEAGLVTGLVRMLVTEHPEARFGVLHLDGNSMKDPSKIATAVADLEKELQDGNSEYEHAIREGVVHIPRLVYDNDLNERYRGMHASAPTLDYAPIHSRGPVIADFETPGSVSTLYFKEDTSGGSLPDDYIEIEVAAVGLDQEDWAACTGRTDNADFFSEVTGIVTRCGSATTARFHPGDHVFALAGGRFATMMTLPACLAQRVSPKVPLSDMASMPVAFCSAINALRHVANIRRGEKVLLHATLADAGSALASAQVAQHLGAEVFAAVESEENADRFATLANISRDSVYTVPSATNESQANPLAGKRFNVILNTTPTTTVGDSWRYLSPRGRFISMGKIDVEKATAIAIGVAARNATFSSFDLRSLVVEDRDFGTQLMQEVGDLFRQNAIRPLPQISEFPVSHVDEALMTLSRESTGQKTVISLEDAESYVKMRPKLPRATFSPDAMYIIVGGLGGLGRAILQWMVDRGARNVTVWSRSGVPHAHAGRMVEQLSARGVRITSTKCDITSETAVNEAMQALLTPSSLPIKGILHTAVTFSDTTFALLSHEQWALGLSAKVSGTKNLHAASLKHQLALDFFIMTSSYEAVVALPTQAAYCAANSFMDSFARYRRSLGLPACAVAFGLITEMGVGQTDVTRNMIARHDLYGTGERGFLQILEAAFLEQPATSASWAQFDPLAGSQITANLDPSKLAKQARSRQNGQIPRWRLDRKFAFVNRAIQDELTSSGLAVQHEESAPEVPAVLLAATDAIREGRVEDAEVAITLAMIERIAALRYLPPESFDARKSLAEYGIDSLGAVELRTWVVNTFRVAIPLMTLLDEALSLRDLGNMVAKGMKIDDA